MKPTQPMMRRIRRLALTTKQAGKGYYKGTGSGSMGTHTKYGGYVIDWNKVRTYVVPPHLDSTPLTPFVARTIRPTRGQFNSIHGGFDPELYLQRWKEEVGRDWIPGENRDTYGNYIGQAKEIEPETNSTAEATKSEKK